MSLTTLDETLATLHPTQRAAVIHPARPLLLACGPGSGKTRILTHRIQWLVQQERVEPVAILALTFSRAAADELRGRLVRALGPLARELWAGTFHGFGAWLLRRHGARLGRTAAFTIFDREDTRRLIGRLVEELSLEADLATLVEAVERAKGQPTPEAWPAAASRLGPLAALLAAYETRCREANAFDFADLLAAPLALFHQDPAVREGLRTRFRAVVVDEAQDLCGLQHALVEALAAPDGAVTLAGDDDQAIYGWRGGDVTRLHAFERTYPGGTVLAVGRNYRSTPEIVASAARLIGHNRARRAKPLAAVRAGGPRPEILTWADDRAEAEGLAAH
jgi:ATP-dependent DNA helicase UvrD/PcrA